MKERTMACRAAGMLVVAALFLGGGLLAPCEAYGNPVSGQTWHQDGRGWWLQRADGSYPAQCWESVGGSWYRFDGSGYLLTGWYKVDGEWNWSDASGVWHPNSWRKDGVGWWYSWADGTYPTSSWQLIGGKWYLFDGSGYMLTGWQRMGGAWYYLNPGGDMATGWKRVGGAWYYLTEGGSMATGWKQVGGSWYYLNSGGDMAAGWKRLMGDWYYLGGDGAMRTGWQLVSGAWYYLQPSGAMATGWQNIGGEGYYLSDSGVMATGTKVICGLTHRFSPSGAWLERIGGGDPVEVKVVDRVVGTHPWGGESVVTKFEYDDAGRIVCSSTMYWDRPSQVVTKDAFLYVGNNVAQVTTYIDTYPAYVSDPEQSETVASMRESFTYDSRGFCTNYKHEVLYQGFGIEAMEYVTDDNGAVLRAVASDYPLSIDDEGPYELKWSYLSNGVADRIEASGPEWYRRKMECQLVPGLTIADRGRYAFSAFGGDRKATVRVDAEGNLTSAEIGESVYVYEYKTILVNADSYHPSIFSNPQASFLWSYDSHWRKPSLTVEDVNRILGR